MHCKCRFCRVTHLLQWGWIERVSFGGAAAQQDLILVGLISINSFIHSIVFIMFDCLNHVLYISPGSEHFFFRKPRKLAYTAFIWHSRAHGIKYALRNTLCHRHSVWGTESGDIRLQYTIQKVEKLGHKYLTFTLIGAIFITFKALQYSACELKFVSDISFGRRRVGKQRRLQQLRQPLFWKKMLPGLF